MKTFITRTLSATVFAAVMLGGILMNTWSFTILFFIITAGALWEYYKLVSGMYVPGKISANTYRYIGVTTGTVIYICFACFAHMGVAAILFFNFIPLVFILLVIELYSGSKNAIANVALNVLGIIYIAVPLGLLHYLVPYEFLGHSNWLHGKVGLPLGILLLIWANDSFAYIGGSLAGRHKLFPSISPGKSWEGFIIGVAGSLVAGYAIAVGFTLYTIQDWLIIAVIVSVTGTFGDLFESMLKRNAGVKDSGSIMPGHGGFLDRFDAFIFCIPFVFLYVTHFINP